MNEGHSGFVCASAIQNYVFSAVDGRDAPIIGSVIGSAADKAKSLISVIGI